MIVKLRCLVVDDEPLARQGMKEYIRETDFLLLQAEASNAAEAAQQMQVGHVDLILLDILMLLKMIVMLKASFHA